jgi:DNA topoisomerase-1
LNQYKSEKIKLAGRTDVDRVLAVITGKKFSVSEIKKQERRRKPPAPYITSKLQQDAANRLVLLQKRR